MPDKNSNETPKGPHSAGPFVFPPGAICQAGQNIHLHIALVPQKEYNDYTVIKEKPENG